MRTRIIVLIGALLLASAIAQAQDTPATPLSPRAGKVDFGLRATNIQGDAARFQRFRDVRDGAYLSRFTFDRERADWVLSVEADNVGYRDQRFAGEFQRLGKVKASFLWDQVPLFISQDTRSLFTHQGGGVLTLPTGLAQGIAAKTTTLAAAQIGLTPFDTRNRRDTGAVGFVYTATRDLDLAFDLKSARREGTMPMAAPFATPGGTTYEVALPIDHRTTDVALKLEWANEKGMAAVRYDGSWFDNSIPTITFDNPLSAVDAAGAPSRGRLAVFPNSTAHTVSSHGTVKLPGRSRATAYVSVGTWSQNADLLPPTINSALALPATNRGTADAEARILAMNYTFTSRPAKYVGVNARYRFYDYGNRTPQFDISSMVVSDVSLGAAHESEPASFNRQNVDVDVTFTPLALAAFKVGYGRGANDYTSKVRTEGGATLAEVFRLFKNVDEDVFRVSGDTFGNKYVSLRAVYEFSKRRGKGFGGESLLGEVGEHLEMRHFDIADRDRKRGTLILQVTPIETFGVNASVAAGHDDYTVDPESLFGLRDNKHRIYTAGFDVVPSTQVDFNVTYGFEKYTAYQYSRTANPLSTDTGVVKQFLDPRRDWSIDSADKVHTVNTSLRLDELVPKTELHFGYDLSKARATYVYGLAPDTTIAAPAQLAPIRSELQTGTADVRYFVRSDVALGAVYWYDRYVVDDASFNVIRDALTIERLDMPTTGTPTGVYLGYVYRPYTANSFALRLTYLW